MKKNIYIYISTYLCLFVCMLVNNYISELYNAYKWGEDGIANIEGYLMPNPLNTYILNILIYIWRVVTFFW